MRSFVVLLLLLLLLSGAAFAGSPNQKCAEKQKRFSRVKSRCSSCSSKQVSRTITKTTVIRRAVSSGGLAELNSIRASRGLPALVEDPSLTVIARQKSAIQARSGAMFHPGGSMGSARYEGVGMGPRFTTCYQDATNVRYAGAASVMGANGQRYHTLLVR